MLDKEHKQFERSLSVPDNVHAVACHGRHPAGQACLCAETMTTYLMRPHADGSVKRYKW